MQAMKDYANEGLALGRQGWNWAFKKPEPQHSLTTRSLAKCAELGGWIIASGPDPKASGRIARAAFILNGPDLSPPPGPAQTGLSGQWQKVTHQISGIKERWAYLKAGNTPQGPAAPHGLHRFLVILVRVGVVAIAGMALAGVGFYAGKALELLGTTLLHHATLQTDFAATALQYSGKASQYVGSAVSATAVRLFQAISVPIYLACQTFPKWCVQSMPRITEIAMQVINWVALNIGERLVNFSGKAFNALAELVPCLKDTAATADRISSEIISPAFYGAFHFVRDLALKWA